MFALELFLNYLVRITDSNSRCHRESCSEYKQIVVYAEFRSVIIYGCYFIIIQIVTYLTV